MEKIITLYFLFSLSFSLLGQVEYDGCTNLITGPNPYTLTLSGTTNDGGITRNTYSSSPVSCSAGSCSFTIVWSISNQRWEITLNGQNLFHYNSTPSAPNPPSLTLGTWQNDSGCSNIMTLSNGVQSDLPVKLFLFDSKVIDKQIKLHWVTASEINNEKFEIEQSGNGIEFWKIGEVQGKGTIFNQQEYSFEVEKPENRLSYFRLKQTDYDGEAEYSKVISVNLRVDDNEISEFYPNPCKSGIVSLDYYALTDNEIIISVFDMAEKLVLTKTQHVSTGNNNFIFDFSDLYTGIFFVKVGDNRNSTFRKLIIER